MKINVVIPNFYPATVYGGPIFSSLHTCKELSNLQDISLYISTTNANMDTRLDVESNKTIKFAENFYVKYYNETKINLISLSLLFNVWKDIRSSDIIHVQYMFNTTTIISLFYSFVFRKKVILSPRGSLGKWCLNQGNRFKGLWLNYLIKPFAKNITWHATSEQEKNEILSIYSDANVTIIPNGIEYDKFQNFNVMNKKEYLQKYTKHELNAEKIIISMGRIQKKKGFDILINSFSKVLDVYSDSILLIAGDDEGEQEALEKQIQQLKLENKVYFIGSILGQDKIDFLANADLFVLPSHNENFGNVYVESLAAGTPIVASTGTPWSEVEKYDCGAWVNNSVEETANAMLKVLDKDREKMRQNCKELAKKYDWSYIAKEFKNLFDKMLLEK